MAAGIKASTDGLYGTLQVNSADIVTFNSSGNVGVGTLTPAAKLDISSGGATKARITSTVDNNADLDFYTNGVQRGLIEGNSIGMLFGTVGALPNIFITNNTERMRIDSSGNVGIGTSSPTQFFQARKDQAAYTWGRFDNQSSSASAYAGVQFGAFGNSWGIAIGSSAANSNALTFVLDAGGSNAEKMRIDSSGTLILNQGQIQFPATQVPSANANTLDDYEEGTWTPQLVTSGGTFSGYGTQQGFYTKVGRLVSVSWYMQGQSLSGTSTNSVEVIGLPFNSISSAEPAGSVWITNSFVAIPLGVSQSTRFGFYKTNTTAVQQVVAGELAGRYIVGSLVYFAA